MEGGDGGSGGATGGGRSGGSPLLKRVLEAAASSLSLGAKGRGCISSQLKTWDIWNAGEQTRNVILVSIRLTDPTGTGPGLSASAKPGFQPPGAGFHFPLLEAPLLCLFVFL